MKRVAITGIGVVAPGGVGREAFWETLVTGKSACDLAEIDRLELFRSHMVDAVSAWTPLLFGLTEDEVRRLDRHIQFALVAAAEAWADSGLDILLVDPVRLGVAAGTAI